MRPHALRLAALFLAVALKLPLLQQLLVTIRTIGLQNGWREYILAEERAEQSANEFDMLSGIEPRSHIFDGHLRLLTK